MEDSGGGASLFAHQECRKRVARSVVLAFRFGDPLSKFSFERFVAVYLAKFQPVQFDRQFMERGNVSGT
jgi:hypothetical protein